MLCYAFSERFKFEVVKIDETASKNVIEEEHGKFGNEGFQAFERDLFRI